MEEASKKNWPIKTQEGLYCSPKNTRPVRRKRMTVAVNNEAP
jgi:hypothetical protein